MKTNRKDDRSADELWRKMGDDVTKATHRGWNQPIRRPEGAIGLMSAAPKGRRYKAPLNLKKPQSYRKAHLLKVVLMRR